MYTVLNWAPTGRLRTEGRPRPSLHIRLIGNSYKIPRFSAEWFEHSSVPPEELNPLSKRHSTPQGRNRLNLPPTAAEAQCVEVPACHALSLTSDP